jgi:hypothetical protein
MLHFCIRKRILFCAWGAILFIAVRCLLSIPLRHLWGPYQLTGETIANISSTVVVVGVVLPVLSERKRLRALRVMPFLSPSPLRQYLCCVHLMALMLTGLTAAGLCLDWGIQIHYGIFFFFITGCYLCSGIAVKDVN